MANDSDVNEVCETGCEDQGNGCDDVTVCENGKCPENVEENSEVKNDSEGTSTTPSFNVIHEDVKEYLKKYLEEQGYTDVTFHVDIGSNLGDNFMGFIGKLTVMVTDKENERRTFNWIVKTAPYLESYRKMVNVTPLYSREAYMYSDVFRIFEEFQKEKHVLKPFDEYSGFILSYMEDLKESLVMKDMKSVGYIMRDRHEPLDLAHVKLVVKAYAKFHGLAYAMKDQKPDVFKTIVENTKDIFAAQMFTGEVLKGQQPMMDKTLTALDEEKDGKMYEVFKKFTQEFPEIVTKLLEDTNERSVIGHGDSWVNNMLWKYDIPNSDTPTKVCLIDWQLARYGSPACDLSYFIFTCTTKEFRDKHYDDMIKLYYYTLCAHVTELGSDPEQFLTFEDLQKELKKYSMVGLYLTVLVLSIITKDSSEIPDWRSDDLDEEEAQKQWLKPSANEDKYKSRVRGVVMDYYEKGYFNDIM